MSALREALRRAEAGELTLAPVEAPAAPPQTAAPAQDLAEPTSGAPTASVTSPIHGSRNGFYATLAVLGLAAIAVAGYFWIQMKPAVPAARAAPAPAVSDSRAAPLEKPPAQAIPGLPLLGEMPRAAPPATPGESRSTTARTASAKKPATDPVQAVEEEFTVQLPASRRIEARVHPRVEAGYAALHAGALDTARRAYRDALDEEPLNRDALLGLAAVERHAQRRPEAERLLEVMLHAHPGDARAQAALIAQRAERVDPLRAESHLKSLLAAEPDAAALHFALGNQYARQARWAEAQQAYLQALRGDSGNPDIAFNLAVSLDHLQQDEAAHRYYSLALALAASRTHAFDAGAAERRLPELKR